jgi:asparagine synthase (glutamine-hydrolysing)
MAPDKPILRDKASGGWLNVAGTLFYEDSTRDEAILRLMRRLAGIPDEVDAALARTEGIFVVVTREPIHGALRLITDRLGSLHVYSARAGSSLLLSTSSLILANLLRPEWDPTGCREFLATGTVFENRSLFQDIEKLPPASVLEFRDGQELGRRKYWDLASVMYDRSPRRGSVPELADALEGSLRVICRNYDKPLLDLTGGFDSRALLGAMLRVKKQIDTTVSGEETSPDVVASRRIAQVFGLRHRVQTPEASPGDLWEDSKEALSLCDGEYNVLEYAGTLRVNRRMAAEFDVSLNGSNGEICKGYWWELLFPFTGSRNRFDEHRIAAGRFAFDEGAAPLLACRYPTTLAEHFAEVIRRANRGFEGLPNTAKLDNVYLTIRMQRWQGRLASATSRIWPVLSPFMWTRPMEVALSAPPGSRVRHRMSRRLIEHLNPSLAALPLAQGYPALPLRPTTAHLFWPLAKELAEKAWRRAWGLFGAEGHPATRAQNPAIGLWENEEVSGLLRQDRMITRELYKPAALESFLGMSRSERFSKISQFGRVLTLELLAQAVHTSI